MLQPCSGPSILPWSPKVTQVEPRHGRHLYPFRALALSCPHLCSAAQGLWDLAGLVLHR